VPGTEAEGVPNAMIKALLNMRIMSVEAIITGVSDTS